MAGCAPLLRDWNGDGTKLIACGGDSNTEQASGPKWCAHLRHLLPGWTTRASAGRGSHAVDVPGTFGGVPISSVFYVERMLAWERRPDVAILAWGTNDVGRHPAPRIVGALAAHAARLRTAGVGVLVATIPHALDDPEHDAAVQELNAALTARFAPCVVDFTTPTPPIRDFYESRLHLNAAGQWARATSAAGALRRASSRCGPERVNAGRGRGRPAAGR